MAPGDYPQWFPEIAKEVSSEGMQKRKPLPPHNTPFPFPRVLGWVLPVRAIHPAALLVPRGWLLVPGRQIKAPCGLPRCFNFLFQVRCLKEKRRENRKESGPWSRLVLLL